MNRKHGRVSRLFRAIPTIFLVLTYTYEVSAKDLLVPGKYGTIGEAIRTAEAGVDRVVITDGGTYRESIVVDKDLVLVSDPPGSTLTNELGAGIKISKGNVILSIEGLHIGKCSGDGIVVDPGPGGKVKLTLSGVSLLSNGKSGISFPSGDNHVFEALDGCRFEQNAEAGILTNRVIDVHISKAGINRNFAGIVLYGNDEGADPKRVSQILIEDSELTGNAVVDSGLVGGSTGRFYAPDGMDVLPGPIMHVSRISMSLVVKRSRIQRNRFIMVSCAEKGFSADMTFLDTTADDNQRMGVVLVTQGAKFTAERSSFSRQNYESIVSYRVVDAHLKDCTISNNFRGFSIYYPDELMEDPPRASQLVFENCVLSGNGWDGICIRGRAGINLSLTDTKVQKNGRAGVSLNFAGEEEPGSCILRMSGGIVGSNRTGGLVIERGKFDVSISNDCKFTGNQFAGISLKDSVFGRIVDCELSSNTPNGLVVTAPRISDAPAWENDPELQFERCNIVDNSGAGICVEGAAKYKFSILDSEIARNNVGVSADAYGGSAVQFVMTGCRFRNNPADPLRISEKGFILMDASKGSKEGTPKVSRWGFVGGHSAVTAVDCTFTDNNGNTVGVPALPGEGTGDVDWDTLEKEGIIPFVPVKSLSSSNAFSVIYSWSERVKDLAVLAEAYHTIGMIEESKKSFENAQAQMLDHPPSGPLQNQVFSRREDTLRDAERVLKSDPAGSAARLLLLLEQSSSEPEISACLAQRYSAFRNLLRLAPSFAPKPPEVPLTDTLKRDILAAYLKELTDLVNKKVPQHIIVDHLNELAGPEANEPVPGFASDEAATENALVSRLFRKDALSSLDDFAVEVEPLLDESPELKVDYHRSMARAYKALHDPAREESHVKSLQELGK